MPRPKAKFELSFRVDDTPYGGGGTGAAPSSSSSVRTDEAFIPHIARDGVALEGAARGILVRASSGDGGADGEIVSVPELHRRKLQEAKRHAPARCCVEIEEERVKTMDDVRAEYDRILKEQGGFAFVPNESFNRWVFESKMWEAHGDEHDASSRSSSSQDPMIPAVVRVSSSLVREMVDDKAKQLQPLCDLPQPIFETLCAGVAVRVAEMAAEKVKKLNATLEGIITTSVAASSSGCDGEQEKQTPVVKMELKSSVAGDANTNTNTASGGGSDVAVISCGDVSHEILAPYAEKFKKMFAAFSKMQQQKQKEDDEQLESRLFCMLQRYRALARGPNRLKVREGSGHHSSVPARVLDKMQQLVGVEMECFASPFNSHFPFFGSAFSDTDSFFGSVGTFFEFFPVEGSMQVNPPYVEEVMDEMRRHIAHLLSSSDRPLSFVIIVPDWVTDQQYARENGGKLKVRESPMPSPAIRAMFEGSDGFTRLATQIQDHAYLDGFQHTFRRALFRTPNPTLLMVMQNDAGAAKWPVSDETFSEPLKREWAAAASGVPELKYYTSSASSSSSLASQRNNVNHHHHRNVTDVNHRHLASRSNRPFAAPPVKESGSRRDRE